MARVFNFAAGPGILPLPVLQQVAENFVDYRGEGMSLIEMSHRGKVFEEIHEETLSLIRELLAIPDTHEILLLQGGGHTQFAMVPLNLLGAAAEATYLVNGTWSKKAAIEAQKFCHVNVIAAEGGVPPADDVIVPNDAAYLYYCQNETVNGIEYNYIPGAPGCVPLVADMSSNFLSRTVDWSRHALVFAGAQKNFGPAGLTVVVIRKDLLGMTSDTCPTMLDYAVHAKSRSLYNTPPTFAIWVANLVCHWIKDSGGIAAMEQRAAERSRLIYQTIDRLKMFYVNRIAPDCRSRMNVVFQLREEALTDLFVKEAASEGMKNLKGHRSVGGLRASLYNAMPLEGARALASFMDDFVNHHAH